MRIWLLYSTHRSKRLIGAQVRSSFEEIPARVFETPYSRSPSPFPIVKSALMHSDIEFSNKSTWGNFAEKRALASTATLTINELMSEAVIINSEGWWRNEEERNYWILLYTFTETSIHSFKLESYPLPWANWHFFKLTFKLLRSWLA